MKEQSLNFYLVHTASGSVLLRGTVSKDTVSGIPVYSPDFQIASNNIVVFLTGVISVETLSATEAARLIRHIRPIYQDDCWNFAEFIRKYLSENHPVSVENLAKFLSEYNF